MKLKVEKKSVNIQTNQSISEISMLTYPYDSGVLKKGLKNAALGFCWVINPGSKYVKLQHSQGVVLKKQLTIVSCIHTEDLQNGSVDLEMEHKINESQNLKFHNSHYEEPRKIVFVCVIQNRIIVNKKNLNYYALT